MNLKSVIFGVLPLLSCLSITLSSPVAIAQESPARGSQTQLIPPSEIELILQELEGWRYENGKIKRQFQFATFIEAFSFMSALALVSESLNHHPEWQNVYNRVQIELTTHEAGGVTLLDIEWARKANGLALQLGAN